jgi:DNA-binding SARP family transcriptional activator/predicted ATPase
VSVAGTALLQIRLLGELQVRRGGDVLALPASRRTRALLAYLVASGASHSRSGLCDLLWEGPDDPRAALRWSLTKLRPLVDDESFHRLRADREHVSFQPSACDIDTQQVQALLAGGVEHAPLAALEQAAGLLQGEFLGGLDLPACYRFHQWCMAQREQHGGLRRRVLDTLVERLAKSPEQALPHARAMVAADPLAAGAHATVVRLLALAGRYPEAEQHYGWARDLLRREVSMADGGPLDQAIRDARRALRPPIAVAPASSASRVGREPPEHQIPLIGRAGERALIESALQAPTGTRRLLLFAGEPGIGKSRLLDHLAHAAGDAGQAVVRGRCFEAEMVRPYGLWIDALRSFDASGMPAGTLAQAAPLLAGGQHAAGGSRETLFDAALGLVRRMAFVQPLALLLDDLQWIDEGSAALLHYVVRQLDPAAPLVLAGAARSGEVDDNPWARSLLQSLAREDRLQQAQVGPLEFADAAMLLRAASAELDAADVLRHAGGNPLYLLELSRAARRGAQGAGRSLDALIEQRLHALDDGARDLLAWAAAMGRELRPETLAAATGLPMAQVLAGLERFTRRGLLVPTGEGHFDFTHDLVRDGVYRALSQPRRRAIHRQIAQALQAASAADPRLHGEIVRHAALADDSWATARACRAAADHCLRVFANRDAAAVADRGLAYLDDLPRGTERAALEIGLLRLRLLAVAASPGGNALTALAQRLQRAITTAEALELYAEAASGWEVLSLWQQQAGDIQGTQQATLFAQQATRRADAATHCRQLANSGRCLLDIEADVVRGRALLEEAEALAAGLQLKVMELEWGRGLLARAAGDLDAARAALERATAMAGAAENHWREYECMVWSATIDWERQRYADVLVQAGNIVQVVRRMGETQAPFAEALAALARLRRGDASAASTLAAALQALREIDDKAHLAYALNEAAALALDDGRAEDAAGCAAEALSAAQAVRRPTEEAVASARLAAARRDAALLPQLQACTSVSARASGALEAAAQRLTTLLSTPAPQTLATDSPGDRPCHESSSSAASTSPRPTSS